MQNNQKLIRLLETVDRKIEAIRSSFNAGKKTTGLLYVIEAEAETLACHWSYLKDEIKILLEEK